MSNPERQRDLIWLHTVRGIAYHVSKIGDLIGKCAEDTEKLIRIPHEGEPYLPKSANQNPHGPGPEDIPGPPRQPQWTKNRQEHFSRYPFNSRPARPGPPQSSYYYPAEYMMPVSSRNYLPPDHELDDQDIERLRRKRRASTSSMDLEHYPRMNGHDDVKQSRPKRVRINWTQEENKVFYDIVKANASMDEQSLIRRIVETMAGKRNWTQCKGHFRNLVFVNKISQDEKTKQWSVNPEAKKPFRTGPSTSNRVSEQSASESEVRPGDKVENGKSQPIKEPPIHEEDDKDEDEDEVEDLELGGDENDGDDEYIAQDDEEDGDGAEGGKDGPNDHAPLDPSRKPKGNGEEDANVNANAVEQARTRILKGSRMEGRPSGDASRPQNGDRRGSDGEEGNRTMPHRKQMMIAKAENGVKPYSTPPRRARELKRRNTAEYRPSSYAEGRRYLK